jgi:hypothetical protein
LNSDAVFSAKYSATVKNNITTYSYDTVAVTGTVSLDGADLDTVGIGTAFRVTKGDKFILITNDGTDSIIGKFTSDGRILEDGGQIRNFGGTGQRATIYYTASIDASGQVVKNPDGSLILNGNDVVILVDPKEFTATVLKDVDATNALSIQVVNGVVQIVDDGVIVDSAETSEAQAIVINTTAGSADNLKLDFDANPGLLLIKDITINMNAAAGDLHDDLTIVWNGQSLTIDMTSASSGTLQIDQ